MVPIVMGAHPDDYLRLAPPHSFLHVDWFASPRHLAEHLKLLATNPTAFNRFFQWKVRLICFSPCACLEYRLAYYTYYYIILIIV